MKKDEKPKTNYGHLTKCVVCGWWIGNKYLKRLEGVCPNCGGQN
jgi:predicted RNA-binding Zn-ribbon protein involved in translation (DUF1610 family)